MNHQHEWAYTDQGVHWCSLDYEPDCTATEIHDVPCDHPEEHEMAGIGTRAVAMKDHSTVLMSRPVVDGRPRYQVQCSCGRKTEVGSRKMVQQDQKAHRKEARRKN